MEASTVVFEHPAIAVAETIRSSGYILASRSGNSLKQVRAEPATNFTLGILKPHPQRGGFRSFLDRFRRRPWLGIISCDDSAPQWWIGVYGHRWIEEVRVLAEHITAQHGRQISVILASEYERTESHPADND